MKTLLREIAFSPGSISNLGPFSRHHVRQLAVGDPAVIQDVLVPDPFRPFAFEVEWAVTAGHRAAPRFAAWFHPGRPRICPFPPPCAVLGAAGPKLLVFLEVFEVDVPVRLDIVCCRTRSRSPGTAGVFDFRRIPLHPADRPDHLHVSPEVPLVGRNPRGVTAAGGC